MRLFKKIALLGVLLGVMLVLSLAEGLLPPLIPPFGRVGLPNIVILYCFTCLGRKEALTLTLLKSGFAFLTRGVTAGMLSAGGGLLSFLCVIALLTVTKKRSSLVALGVTGALAHNLGQLTVFSFIAGGGVFWFYMPAVIIAGCITGFATGTIFRVTLPALRRLGFLTLLFAFLLTGCTGTRYTGVFDTAFDTVTTVTVYASNPEESDSIIETVRGEAFFMHELFDIYNTYQGRTNLKTVNDNAGKAPVEAEPLLIELLLWGKEAYEKTDGAVNIAMGAVLRLWHEARESGVLPDTAKLEEAAKHCDIDNLIIEGNSVYLSDPEMSLDVGAIAKGFAAQKIKESAGDIPLLLDMGGNITACAKPADKTAWNVGIRDPYNTSALYKSVQIKQGSVVSSGGYERFAVIGGKTYHHIIDFKTLMPADLYASVTILHENSAVADMLSTALFIMRKEEGEKLAASYGAEVVYVDKR